MLIQDWKSREFQRLSFSYDNKRNKNLNENLVRSLNGCFLKHMREIGAVNMDFIHLFLLCRPDLLLETGTLDCLSLEGPLLMKEEASRQDLLHEQPGLS